LQTLPNPADTNIMVAFRNKAHSDKKGLRAVCSSYNPSSHKSYPNCNQTRSYHDGI